MKKRKTPVLMFSALGGLLLVVVFINLSQMGLIAPPAQEKAAAAEQPPGTPATDKNIKDQMKANLSNVVGGSTKMTAPGSTTVAPEPTVAVPKPVITKQKPNDSSTGTQWWSEDSARSEEDK